jgi:hypothetical protein
MTRVDRPRSPAAPLPPGWGDKTDEQLVKKPFYRRQWFRRLLAATLLAGLAVGVFVGFLAFRWHRAVQAELAQQRQGVEAFVGSPEFAAFARDVDAQAVAMLNFAALRPRQVSALWPEIAAAEKARRVVPWPVELLPVPVSLKDHPARVQEELRRATALLTQRGFDFAAARTGASRRVLWRLMAPHARAFAAQDARLDLVTLSLDRRMQRIVLEACAERSRATVEEIEDFLVLYSAIGPALWQAIEAEKPDTANS